jgi:ribosomal protein L11 methyltransferase
VEQYYYELKITPESLYEQFLQLVMSLTNEAIEEDNGTIISRSTQNLDMVQYGITQFANAMDIKCEVELSKHKNEDWINNYKNAIEPIAVGDFYVRPSWVEPKDDLINIIIDPALSFGSGHHETTSSCLEALSKYAKDGSTMVDVGCGSGILAIAAAKLGVVCDACDTDKLAVEDTLKNCETNKVKLNDTWTGSITISTKKYDIVMANIVADVLILIASDLKKSLKKDAILILSGILDKHHDKVLKKFNNLDIIQTIHKNEWVTIILKNN